MRLRGFSLLCNVLTDFDNDNEMRLLVRNIIFEKSFDLSYVKGASMCRDMASST